jgi:lipid II:glycine glycyltransferase (peptidoglycan interpeptide bridge formation enzyme)
LAVHAIPLDSLPSDDAAPFLQCAFWGRHKSSFDWEPHAFRIEAGGAVAGHLLALCRSLGRGFRFAYVPHGPSRETVGRIGSSLCLDEPAVLTSLAKTIQPMLGNSTVFVRWDLDWVVGRRSPFGKGGEESDNPAPSAGEADPRASFNLAPLVRAGADVQPPDTVIIGLQAGPEAVLAGMKPKTRYNVRLAEKKGVRVETAGPEALPAWYAMYGETARRDRIALHSFEYYRTLLEQNPDRIELLLAWHEGDLLAGNIMLYAGKRATYLYGASSNVKRNLMPTYLLQWTGLQRAIDRGCESYDCYGIPPSADPGHPMHGLYQFKTGLGGEVVNFPGCWDSPTRPVMYRLYRLAEGLRYLYFKKLKKR